MHAADIQDRDGGELVMATLFGLYPFLRLAKDWENLNRRGLAFLRLASIRCMLRKLCNPT